MKIYFLISCILLNDKKLVNFAKKKSVRCKSCIKINHSISREFRRHELFCFDNSSLNFVNHAVSRNCKCTYSTHIDFLVSCQPFC